MRDISCGLIWIGTTILLLTPNVVKETDGARILCVSHQFGSHMLMVHTAAEELVQRGHEVYSIFSDRMSVPQDVLHKGFKVIRYHTPEWSDIFGSEAHAQDALDSAVGSGAVNHQGDSIKACQECYDMDNDTTFMRTLEELHFDLVLSDTFPLCNCLYFIPLKLGIPFIPIAPFITSEITRIPSLPTFVPLPHAHTELTDDMSFFERIQNTMATFFISVPALSQFPGIRDRTLLQKYNKDPSVSTWTQLGRKAALFLIPRGHVLEFVTPFMPHVINIECLTCKPGKDLPQDLATMVEQNKAGVIVISFGSLIDRLPDDITEQFLDAFERREELVLWRFKGRLPRNVSNNIKVMKWLPQNDLLAHPKTKLFITHAGNNGQYESVYHGVPMLAFPLFAEQPHNAHRIVAKGFGLKSNIRSVTSEELLEKIEELISNPKYKENTVKAGKILKAAPMTAQQTAAYWIEHVLEFGSDHLKSHALEMNWYSFYGFDILLFLLVLLSFSIICIILTLRMIAAKCIRKVTKEKEN